MAPCKFRKNQGVPAGGLALLVALVLVGLISLPGGAAQHDVDKNRAFKACGDRPQDRILRLSCLFGGTVDIKRHCCPKLKAHADSASDCVCAVLKVFEGRGLDVDNLCNTIAIAKPCQDKAQGSQRQDAQDHEGLLPVPGDED
jgi:hypothetical protein